MASLLPLRGVVDMFRVASLLIVMALAASPTAKVICDLTCLAASESGSPGHPACHHAPDDGEPAVKALPEPCARVVTVTPFTPESAYRVAPAAPVPVVVAVAEHVHERCSDAGLLLTRVDTGPPTDSHVAVLRI
jgi:hypothetical protein